LQIESVSPSGDVTGMWIPTGLSSSKLNGVAFWSETEQELKFIGEGNPANPTSKAFFAGYLFAKTKQHQGPPTLAGSIDAFAGAGASAPHSRFGWYAILKS